MDKLYTNFKQTWNELYTNFKQTLNKLWTNILSNKTKHMQTGDVSFIFDSQLYSLNLPSYDKDILVFSPKIDNFQLWVYWKRLCEGFSCESGIRLFLIGISIENRIYIRVELRQSLGMHFVISFQPEREFKVYKSCKCSQIICSRVH